MPQRLQLTAMASLRATLSRFVKARDGAAAIEFLFVLPILVTLYFGSFEGSRLYEVSRKANTVTETVGDLVGRTREITTDELDNIFDISRAIIAPFDVDELTVRITGISFDDQSKSWKVKWSRGDNIAGLGKGTSFPVGPDLKSDASKFYVIVDSTYSYTSPILDSVIASELDIERRFAVIPRLSDEIPCTNC